MLRPRIMPCLLLSGRGLVKTTNFKDPRYLGDPRNAVRIFNEKEVDELILIDIGATSRGTPVQFDLIREIVSEAFMPVAYGGGLRSVDDCRRILSLGVEKVVLSSTAVTAPEVVRDAAREFGSQSVAVCLDVKPAANGAYEVWTHSARQLSGKDAISLARDLEKAGAGEIIVNSIDRDGVMAGYDLEIIKSVSSAVRVPVVACGGAGRLEDFRAAVAQGASAAAAGSFFVFHGRLRGVLISFPSPDALNLVVAGGRA